MPIIIQKFGGTSVNGNVRMKECAKLVAKEISLGNKVVVVVSAMVGVTDSLLSQIKSMVADEAHELKNENDVVLSAGEQISSGLMAIALNGLGIKARSWLGWQLPITTDSNFSEAAIKHVEIKQLLADLENGITPVVAGFQGVYEGKLTTLGRGGSDTTAAALAAALKAKRCDIYTDVDGVYTADPKIVDSFKKLETISYNQLLYMAKYGAKVVHPNCVAISMANKVPLQIISSFHEESGTLVKEDADNKLPCVTNSGTAFALIAITTQQEVLSLPNIAHAHSEIIKTSEYTYIKLAASIKEIALSALQNDMHTNICSVHDNLRSVSLVWPKANLVQEAKVKEVITSCNVPLILFTKDENHITAFVDDAHFKLVVSELHEAFCLS